MIQENGLIRQCKETIVEKSFFIKDGLSGVAQIADSTDWDIHVINHTIHDIEFLKIDKCIYGDDEATHCDLGLYNKKAFFFIEIKGMENYFEVDAHRVRSKKRREARKQLSSTINLFKSNHGLEELSHVHGVIALIPSIDDNVPMLISTKSQTVIDAFDEECGCLNIHEGNLIEFK